MHGFFIDLRLYEKAKAIANPFAYTDYREREAKEKLAKESGSRIRATMKLPKVNKQLATKMMLDEAKARRKAGGSDVPVAEGGALKDNRFADLFTNPDFQVDEGTNEYKLLNPVQSTKKPSYRIVGDDEIEEASEASNSDGSDVDSDEDLIRVSTYKSGNNKKKSDQITSIRSGIKDRKRIPKMEALKVLSLCLLCVDVIGWYLLGVLRSSGALFTNNPSSILDFLRLATTKQQLSPSAQVTGSKIFCRPCGQRPKHCQHYFALIFGRHGDDVQCRWRGTWGTWRTWWCSWRTWWCSWRFIIISKDRWQW